MSLSRWRQAVAPAGRRRRRPWKQDKMGQGGLPMRRTAILWRRFDQAGHDSALLTESDAGAVMEGTGSFTPATNLLPIRRSGSLWTNGSRCAPRSWDFRT